ncbi:MAG: hypothetical protein HQK96_19825 [Nitrospirae bacterium]|nr:hypothetical protein [Nitrospirota bacterium]
MDKFAIIQGIVVNVIWFILGRFSTNIIPYYYNKLLHHEPSIAGKWKTTFKENDKESHEVVMLEQTGDKVKGIITEITTDDTYVQEFKGTFKHLTLVCTFESREASPFGRGAFTLRYDKRKHFKGIYLFISNENKLLTSEYEWKWSE